MHYKSRWLGPSLIWFFKGIKFVITFFWKHFHLFLTKGWNRFRRMKIFFLNFCCCFHKIFLTYFFFQYVDWSSEEQDVKDAMITNETAKVQLLFGLLSSSIEMIRRFCERIPGISELCSNDKDILFYSACLELFILRTAYR